MHKIQVLDSHLTNMIAAGEVVERPAGIVKELVENSIDAQATQIEVHFTEGGMGSIDVIDNGIGMSDVDIAQAFERHSTSKISKTQDLNQITSFGFRGEALPSIASVSVVEASSNDGSISSKITVNNGVKSDVVRFARNRGTTISVKHLFSKTPARLKYIKNIHYETSIIVDTMQKFAMARPDIAFSVYNDTKLVFRSHGRHDILDVFHRIYGGAISKDARLFESSNFDFKIEGVMALPQHNRANRYAVWLYVNDRMIRYQKAQKAIIDAYRRYMPSDRCPIVVMKITVDPQLVDVNVHPSKWEIRLSKEAQLVELIQSYLENQLADQMRPQRMSFKPTSDIPIQQDFNQLLVGTARHDKKPLPMHDLGIADSFKPDLILEEPDISPKPFDADLIHDESNNDASIHETLETSPQPDIEIPSQPGIEPLTLLSQMSGKYILAQGDLGLYIIDQHAAMERVRYEYFQEKLFSKETVLQEFLVPLVLEGRKALVTRIDAINKVFEPFKIVVEPFGDDALIVRSVPVWIPDKEVSEFINNILDMFEADQSVREEDMRRLSIATLACHSSVRFNEYMSKEAMETLIEQLRACQQPFHCPHGRPTFITVEHDQLIKEFKR